MIPADVSSTGPAVAPPPEGDAPRTPEDSTPTTRGSEKSRRGDPIRHVYAAMLVVLSVGALLVTAQGPIRDVDAYWHVLLGRDILAGSPIAAAARGWTFAPVDDHGWASTQWLAEVGLARLVDLVGLQGLVMWRVVSLALVLVVLWATTLRGRPLRGAVWPFLIAATMATLATEERSQQITFILAPLVGWWAARLLRSGVVPRWWVVVALTAVWSNIHGGWVLLPMALVLASLGRGLDAGWRDRAVARGLLCAVIATLGAAVSPGGISNITSFLRFRSSAAAITEWLPVTPWDWAAVPIMSLILLLVVSWARGRRRPTRGELFLVLPVLAFALSAWRNTAPAALLLAPLAADIVCESWGIATSSSSAPTRTGRRALVVAAVAGVVALVAVLAGQQQPVDPDAVPRALLADLHATTSPQRLLNTYNVAGATLYFAGPPGVTVGIDGRADLYGNAYILNYQQTLLTAAPGWEATLDQLAPTAALLSRRQGLVGVLETQRHWVEVAQEGDYVLLRAPDAPGWPSA